MNKTMSKVGFTDKVMQKLAKYGEERSNDFYSDYRRYFAVPSDVLIDIANMLPKENIEEDRQNDSPLFKDFLELAKKDPRILFEVYVITSARWDERVTIDGVLLPADREDLKEYLMEKAMQEPDEYNMMEYKLYLSIWDMKDPNDGKIDPNLTYMRMWWD
jgi:hypothetical protein